MTVALVVKVGRTCRWHWLRRGGLGFHVRLTRSLFISIARCSDHGGKHTWLMGVVCHCFRVLARSQTRQEMILSTIADESRREGASERPDGRWVMNQEAGGYTRDADAAVQQCSTSCTLSASAFSPSQPDLGVASSPRNLMKCHECSALRSQAPAGVCTLARSDARSSMSNVQSQECLSCPAVPMPTLCLCLRICDPRPRLFPLPSSLARLRPGSMITYGNAADGTPPVHIDTINIIAARLTSNPLKLGKNPSTPKPPGPNIEPQGTTSRCESSK